MVDVADPVQPVGAGDAQAVVDVQPGAGFQADGLQAEVVGVRDAAGGEGISSASIRSPAEVTATTVPSARPTDSTEVPVRTSTPASVRASATSSPANGSMRFSRPLPRTSRGDPGPRACQAVAISVATTPPPTTISRPGADAALVASRLVHGLTSARGRAGRAAGRGCRCRRRRRAGR